MQASNKQQQRKTKKSQENGIRNTVKGKTAFQFFPDSFSSSLRSFASDCRWAIFGFVFFFFQPLLSTYDVVLRITAEDLNLFWDHNFCTGKHACVCLAWVSFVGWQTEYSEAMYQHVLINILISKMEWSNWATSSPWFNPSKAIAKNSHQYPHQYWFILHRRPDLANLWI